MQGVHPLQASPDFAEAAFSFLDGLGFKVDDRLVTAGNTSRDGWRLSYSSLAMKVVVQYLDSQFEILFIRGETTASYLFLDRYLFDRRSGLHGDMFSPQELAPVVNRIANDIRDHYRSILSDDTEEWERIGRLLNVPLPKR